MSRNLRIDVGQDAKGLWAWMIVDTAHHLIESAQGYPTKRAATHAALSAADRLSPPARLRPAAMPQEVIYA